MNDLAALIHQWTAAKAAERAAAAQRLSIEEQIVVALPGDGPESTAKAEAAGHRIKVTYRVARSVDSDALMALWPSLAAKSQGCFKWKADIKLAELRKVQKYLPSEYATLAKLIEAKPAKPSVTVEALETAEA